MHLKDIHLTKRKTNVIYVLYRIMMKKFDRKGGNIYKKMCVSYILLSKSIHID